MKHDNRFRLISLPGFRDAEPPKLDGFTVASSIPPKSTEWLWYPYIPAGELTILAAPGGVGKGLAAADIAARVSRGCDWPMSDEPAPLGNVLWYEAEDRINKTVVPRLIAAKANLEHIAIEKNAEAFFALQRSTLQQLRIKLIVLSPLFSFLQLKHIGDELEVRAGLEQLGAKIDDLGCAILAIMHPNKKIDLAAIERLLGSVAFGNVVRSVVLLAAEDAETARWVHGKQNLSIKGNDLLFVKSNRKQATHPRGQYIGIDWERADENIDASTAFERKRITDEDKSAAAWLKEHLGDSKWHKLPDIVAAAEPYGHSRSALQKAKQRTRKIKFKYEGFGKKTTFWRLQGGRG
jgi:RecA-family ATPase